MATEPTSFASPLIAALRGGIADTGRASTVSLLPNFAPNYAASAPFKSSARTGNINVVQPFGAMPAAQPKFQDGRENNDYFAPITTPTFLTPTIVGQSEPEVPDYRQDLWPPIEQEPTAPEITEPAPAISYPVTMPSLMESRPLEPELTPSVDVSEVPVGSTTSEPATTYTSPEDLFDIDRELGLIQQQDVMEPVAPAPAPAPAPEQSYTDVPLIQEPAQDMFFYEEPVVTDNAGPVYAQTDTTLDPLIEEVLSSETRPESYYNTYTTDPTFDQQLSDQDLLDMALFDMMSQDLLTNGGFSPIKWEDVISYDVKEF